LETEKREENKSTMITPISEQHHTDDFDKHVPEGETDRQDRKSADKGELVCSLSISQLTKILT
jgi:hypothetical protein